MIPHSFYLDCFASLPTLAGIALVVGGNVHLVERRGRQERLDPRRQVEIRTILQAIPEPALVVDTRGAILEANQGAAALTGMSREQLSRTTLMAMTRAVAHGDEATLEIPKAIFSRAMHGDIVRNERRVLRNPHTGTTVEVLISANPIRSERGEVLGALVIARDVTELTQLQRRIGDIERHHAIGQMAAALAHDFNNVLDAIGQAAALLQGNTSDEAERQSLLQLIRDSVRRGAEIIARIREYLRTGKSAQGPVDVRQVIEETVQLTRPLWQRAGIRMEKKLRNVGCISGNAADLRRVFTNLIINSVEAMPKGGKITVYCGEEHGKVVAEVADTGEGIPEEQRKNIFYAYHTTKAGGTGLGLSGAQKIILAQGGHIGFESQVGKGTKVRIEWPIVRNGQAEKHNEGNGSRRERIA
ncbi:MAG TPA: ATP-binding protein [Terriglobales bacterium]|nr:ATP-binding protein [Terriglobales bacterium]